MVVAVNLPQSVVVPVLPAIGASYGADQVTATWLITGFLLSSGVATPLLGRLGDGIGQRRILAGALVVLALGCAGAALAHTIGWAIAMRFVQGVSGGAVPVAFSAVRAAVPPERLTYGVAVLATVGSIAFSLGIVVSGPLLSAAGPGAVFLLPCVVALLAAVGVLLVIPSSTPATAPVGRFGPLPVLLFSGGLVSLLLAISQSGRRGWDSPVVLGLGVAGALLGGLWAQRERLSTAPFIDLRMMRRRGVWTGNLVAVLAGIGLFGCAAGLPLLLRTPSDSGYGVGASVDEVGLLMAPIALAAFVTSLCTGHLYRRFSARALLVAGAVLSAASYVGIAGWHDSRWVIVGWCALQGVGNGLILSTVAGVVVAAVPAHQTGVASGLNTNVRTIGGSFGAAATAAILSAHTRNGATDEHGFVVAFSMMAGAMAVAGVAALLVPGPGAEQDEGRQVADGQLAGEMS
ncbi:MFS transporter [Nocardioides panacihumi]|uniref:MFS transporter n=1 Tax=Nocardioides panacihumi TaxID=400774 RepID=A0ABN2QAE6_9ACTN